MRDVEGALTAKGHVTLFGHLFFMIPIPLTPRPFSEVTLRALKMIDDSIQRGVAGILRNLGVQKACGENGGAMNRGVRVLKRERFERSKNLRVDLSDEKNDRQSNREIVSTVKSWIAELDLRRISRRTEALRLLKS